MVNEQNEKYLKNQLDFLGFSERLHSQLEEKMREGKPEFTLQDTGQFNDDKMEAVIHFRFSEKDGKEAYFCNHYIATLLREEQNRSQFIYVNSKGQSITFKESCNLLNHRCVFKQITPREGAAKQTAQGESAAKDNNPYWAWLRVDPNNIDPKTGYPKLRQFTEKYGFNLKEAVERVKFKGMEYDDYTKGIMKSLRKGNLVGATLIKDGREIPVTIEANPQMRTLNMYDKHGEKMFYPMQKVETKYGQAPADAKRNDQNPANETGKDLSKSNGQVAGAQGPQEHAAILNEPGAKYEKKNLLDKKPQGNGLLEKNKNRSRSRSKKLS